MNKPTIKSHKQEGVFIIKNNTNDYLATLNISPGSSVYGEKLFSFEDVEYRTWNPFRSKIAASILGGIEKISIKPGSKVLYLGAASGTTVSHCSDIVGAEGTIYAVEFSQTKFQNLQELSKTRTNIVPIHSDARKPKNYGSLNELVDVICIDVDQPDQERILALNAQHFLKKGGSFLIFVNAPVIDSTVKPPVVFAQEVQKLRNDEFKPCEQLTLEPFEKDHCVIIGSYEPKIGK
eukprot:gene2234-2408_t